MKEACAQAVDQCVTRGMATCVCIPQSVCRAQPVLAARSWIAVPAARQSASGLANAAQPACEKAPQLAARPAMVPA